MIVASRGLRNLRRFRVNQRQFLGAAGVPYDLNFELPKSVRDHLPEHAQTIYREAFNHAWQQYVGDSGHEEVAHRIAWSAVRRKYRKAGDRWVSKND
jgi:cation transport regulator